MRHTIATVALVGLLAATLAAQDQAQDQERMAAVRAELEQRVGAQGGVARIALETRVIKDKPYSAEAITEFVQVLGDGNRIVRKSSARLFRDSDGRTRREELTDSGAVHEYNSVTITDPVAGSSFVLHAGTRTATKSPGMFARMNGGTVTVQRSAPAVTVIRPDAETKVEVIPSADGTRAIQAQAAAGGPATFVWSAGQTVSSRAANAQISKEDLGEQVIEGVTATGTRTTSVIPAGAVGNEQPITTIAEQWFSADLGLLVLTRHNDPRVGETTYRLVNISRNEPDRTLFQVPSDYTVQERPPVMMRRQQQY